MEELKVIRTMGDKIRAYLDSHGIKQTFLAEQTGLDISTISAILLRGRKIECQEYNKICKALNVPLEYFFDE